MGSGVIPIKKRERPLPPAEAEREVGFEPGLTPGDPGEEDGLLTHGQVLEGQVYELAIGTPSW